MVQARTINTSPQKKKQVLSVILPHVTADSHHFSIVPRKECQTHRWILMSWIKPERGHITK
jgi:hypothetical protein